MSPAIRRRRTPGFTLIELIVGLAVGAIVLAAIAASIVAMNQVFQANGTTKTTVESGRASLSFLERTLPKAGYGIPPQFAFDFGLIAGVTAKDNQLGPGSAFVTDDLAYRYRDPTYMRFGSIDPGFGTVTLEGIDTFGINIRQGQALMVACNGRRLTFVVVRTLAPAGPGASSVAVAPYGAPFPTPFLPANVTGSGCLQGTGFVAPNVMLLHEMRVRVVPLPPNNRPFLIVNHNMLDLADFDVLAADVENFQVAYVMNQPSALVLPVPPVVDAASAAPNWVFGDDPAVVPDLPSTAATVPVYLDPYGVPARFNAHPANIRSVRIQVTLKSKSPMPNQQVGSFLKESIGNYTAAGAPDSFYRLTLSTQVTTPNMAARGFMTPDYADTTNPTDMRNKWGG